MEKHRFLMWFALLFIGVVSGYAQQLAITGRVLAVSYTHLDVYKRQVFLTGQWTLVDFA